MIQKKIEACGTTDYVAQYLEDTAVFAAFGCAGQRAGFYLKEHITDRTYTLDNDNSGWYIEGTASYQTDSVNTGILKKGKCASQPNLRRLIMKRGVKVKSKRVL